MRGRTRLDREERRRQIVDAASSVLDGRDVAKVTFEEIADAAGVSRALVYDYFGDRQGLLDAVYQQASERVGLKVSEALSSQRGLRPALHAMVRAHVELASIDLHQYRLACSGGAPPVPNARWVERTASAFGGSPRAWLVATGIVSAVQAMVVAWAERADLSVDEASETISALLWRGLSEIDQLGCSLEPWWPVPEREPEAAPL